MLIASLSSTKCRELLGKNKLYGAKSSPLDKKRSAAALKTLQGYLERHDNAASNYKYRLGVIEKILSKNSDFDLPPWLTMHYLVGDSFMGQFHGMKGRNYDGRLTFFIGSTRCLDT